MIFSQPQETFIEIVESFMVLMSWKSPFKSIQSKISDNKVDHFLTVKCTEQLVVNFINARKWVHIIDFSHFMLYLPLSI